MGKSGNLETLTEFAGRLNRIIGHNLEKLHTPEIVENPRFNECSCKGLLEGYFYVYIPSNNVLQERVKKEIAGYSIKQNLKFIITNNEYCGDNECHGHYVDPFEREGDDKPVFVNGFPEDINGGHIHFLNEKNFQVYEQMIKKLKIERG